MKTALQEYTELNPQVGEHVIVAVPKIFGRGTREVEGEIVALHPDTAEVEIRFANASYAQRFGPSAIVARVVITRTVVPIRGAGK